MNLLVEYCFDTHYWFNHIDYQFQSITRLYSHNNNLKLHIACLHSVMMLLYASYSLTQKHKIRTGSSSLLQKQIIATVFISSINVKWIFQWNCFICMTRDFALSNARMTDAGIRASIKAEKNQGNFAIIIPCAQERRKPLGFSAAIVATSGFFAVFAVFALISDVYWRQFWQ